MSVADTANLVVKLSLGGNFNQQLKTAQSGLGKFNAAVTNSSTRAYKAGQQIGTGIKNAVKIAAVAVGTLTGLLVLSIKEGQEAAKVQIVYAKAIANSGKVSAAYVTVLNKQQTALMNLAGVDDELIKAEQTRLIQMGLTGKQVAKLTPLILDTAKATGKDLLTVTLAVGKAVLGNTGALGRLGIVLPKVSKSIKGAARETAIFDNVQAALNQRFGGTTKALSGSFDVRLAALRENLANIREEAGQRLLPVLTRIVDVVGRRVVPAFGEFMDRILPGVISGLDKLVGMLEGGGAESGLASVFSTIKSVAPVLQNAAEVTGRVVKEAVGLFRSLPTELQGLLVAGLAVNKLTGGLVTNIAGGLISAVLKRLVSAQVNIAAANVNVVGGGGLPGGLPGGLGAVGAGAAGITASAVAALILAPAVIAATGILITRISDPGGVRQDRGRAAIARARGIPEGNIRPGPGFDPGGTRGLPFGGHSPFDTSSGGAVGAVAGAGAKLQRAATQLISAANALKQAKFDVPKILDGIRARSAARFGGKGLGEGAVNATFNRDLLRLARNTSRSGWTAAQKLNRLNQLAAEADVHGGRQSRAVAAEIRRLKAKVSADLKAQKTTVTVNATFASKVMIDGRTTVAQFERYVSTVTGHAPGHGPLP